MFFFLFFFFFSFLLAVVVVMMMGAGKTHFLANKCVQTSYYPNHLFVGFPIESSAHLEIKEVSHNSATNIHGGYKPSKCPTWANMFSLIVETLTNSSPMHLKSKVLGFLCLPKNPPPTPTPTPTIPIPIPPPIDLPLPFLMFPGASPKGEDILFNKCLRCELLLLEELLLKKDFSDLREDAAVDVDEEDVADDVSGEGE